MDLKARVKTTYEQTADELAAISKWLYEHPEVALQEHESSARLVEFLAGAGFDVEYPAYGLDTSFVARAGKGGPEVIICAEYDALPEVGHACGHNIIAAAAIGAGTALAGVVDELGCRITVLGTPAEEAIGGKIDLIEAGAFDDAAAAIMVHPARYDIIDPVCLAVVHVDVDFYGKEAHASAAPQRSINALDAAVQAYVNVSTLRQSFYATDRVHGTITYGGAAPNVIPAHTSMSWYVRAATIERLDELYPKVVNCFEAAAKATGCRLALGRRGHTFIDLVSNPTLMEVYQENTTSLGRPMGRGSDLPIEEAGSTDMGNVSHELPSIHPMLDLRTGGPENHEAEFAAHTITADGHDVIRDGALGMAWTIIDLATKDLWTTLSR